MDTAGAVGAGGLDVVEKITIHIGVLAVDIQGGVEEKVGQGTTVLVHRKENFRCSIHSPNAHPCLLRPVHAVFLQFVRRNTLAYDTTGGNVHARTMYVSQK